MPTRTCKPIKDGGAGTVVYGSDCPCPPSLPYSSEFYNLGGYYVHSCGNSEFAPGIVSGSGSNSRPPLSDVTGYPTQTEVPGPPLNLPSRADQKANIFNKAFDPKNRKLFILLIAGFLLFLALTNYE